MRDKVTSLTEVTDTHINSWLLCSPAKWLFLTPTLTNSIKLEWNSSTVLTGIFLWFTAAKSKFNCELLSMAAPPPPLPLPRVSQFGCVSHPSRPLSKTTLHFKSVLTAACVCLAPSVLCCAPHGCGLNRNSTIKNHNGLRRCGQFPVGEKENSV